MADRRSWLTLAVIALLALCGAALIGAKSAAIIEESAALRAGGALSPAGRSWARVEADGLLLTLRGEAPNAASRDEALAVLARLSGAPFPGLNARIVDQTTLSAAPTLIRAPAELFIMRGADAITVTGVAPDSGVQAAFRAAMRNAAPEIPVSDFSAENSAPAPGDWAAAARAAARMAAALEHGRVEIAGKRLRLNGAARDAAAAESIEDAVKAAEAAGWSVSLELAPTPTASIAFAIHAESGPGAQRPLECVAGDEAGATRLSGLAAALTPPGGPCAAAAGAPNGWGEAAEAGLAALAALPAGEFHLVDQRARLTLSPPTERAAFDAAAAALRDALPDGYQLAALAGVAPPPQEAESAAPADSFDAPPPLILTHDGDVLRIEGGVPDPLIGEAIIAFARARLAHGEVEADIAYGGGFDTDWRAAAMSAISVLARLESGRASVTPEGVTIEGSVETPLAITELHRMLAEGLTDERVAATRFRISPARLSAKELLPPGRCASDLTALTEADPIRFAPGSSEIEAGGDGVIDRLAAVLVRCADGRIEIGGHTDSQGSAAGNMALSRARAESVLTRLLKAGARLSLLSAKGYGEDEPIADNATEKGRARNRRIAFRALEEVKE